MKLISSLQFIPTVNFVFSVHKVSINFLFIIQGVLKNSNQYDQTSEFDFFGFPSSLGQEPFSNP